MAMSNRVSNAVYNIRVDHNAGDFLLDSDVREYGVSPSSLVRYGVLRNSWGEVNVHNVDVQELIDAYYNLLEELSWENNIDDFPRFSVEDDGNLVRYDVVDGYRVV